MTTVENRLKDIGTITQELTNLILLDNPTRQQTRRIGELTSSLNALKAGATMEELRNQATDELMQEVGLAKSPEKVRSTLDPAIANEWRQFALGREVRQTSIPKESEVRANIAGSESITSSTLAAGSAFVPTGFSDRAYESMKAYDQVFDPHFSNIIETATGSNCPFPIWNDTDNDSVLVSESQQSSEVDVANFGSTQLGAYSFRSKLVAVSTELIQDSQFPIGQILERVFAARHARGVGKSLVSGSGVSAPTGLLTGIVASGVVPTIASGSNANDGLAGSNSTNSVGTADISTVYHSLEPIYRPGSAWYMNDTTLQFLDSLTDKNGRPIVHFGGGSTGATGDVPYIFGKPVAICPSFPDISSAANPIVYGNPTYFISRRVPSSMYVRRFSQAPLLAEFGLVAFESYLRTDSNVIIANAAHSPWQFLQSHS